MARGVAERSVDICRNRNPAPASEETEIVAEAMMNM